MRDESLDRPFVEKFSNTLGAVILLATAYYTLSHWGALPDRIATHFDALGKPNGYGSKYTLLILLGMMLFMHLLFMIVSRFPKAFNYVVKITEENRNRQERLATDFLHILRLEVLALLAYIQWGIITGAVNDYYRLNPTAMITMVALLLLSTAIYFYRSIKMR